MTSFLLFATLIIASIFPSSLSAGFAAPVDSSITIPSGEKVVGRLKGNEFFHWFEGNNGKFYTLDATGKKYIPYTPTTATATSAVNGVSSPKASHDAIKNELNQKFMNANKANSHFHTGHK
jgi:hypothetical protein